MGIYHKVGKRTQLHVRDFIHIYRAHLPNGLQAASPPNFPENQSIIHPRCRERGSGLPMLPTCHALRLQNIDDHVQFNIFVKSKYGMRLLMDFIILIITTHKQENVLNVYIIKFYVFLNLIHMVLL